MDLKNTRIHNFRWIDSILIIPNRHFWITIMKFLFLTSYCDQPPQKFPDIQFHVHWFIFHNFDLWHCVRYFEFWKPYNSDFIFAVSGAENTLEKNLWYIFRAKFLPIVDFMQPANYFKMQIAILVQILRISKFRLHFQKQWEVKTYLCIQFDEAWLICYTMLQRVEMNQNSIETFIFRSFPKSSI